MATKKRQLPVVTGEDGTHSVSVEAACDRCRGTGLYVGMAERDGAAVVCSTCQGKGRRVIKMQWTDPHSNLGRSGVERVWATSAGICIAPSVVTGGVPYDTWLSDPDSVHAVGTEMRSHTCPRQWWQSSHRSGPEPDLSYGCGWGRFSECSKWNNKLACWARWDKERTEG